MSNFLSSSIGKKFLMSTSGFFLLMFLTVHFVVNSMMLFDSTGELYNRAAHFMGTNPLMKVIEPVLAIGFLVHIFYAGLLTLQNRKARPQPYAVVNDAHSSNWTSRNMFVLGALVLIFMAIHLTHFFYKIKFGGMENFQVSYHGEKMDDTFHLVRTLFDKVGLVALYFLGGVFLGLHLLHAFGSAFQTMGLSNKIWHQRLTNIGRIYTLIVAGGFALIPLYFFIF